MQTHETMRLWVGIDVSKATLDVRAIPARGRGGRFSNDEAGFVQMAAWLEHLCGVPAQHTHICLEATGFYSDALSHWLVAHGYPVSVVACHTLTFYRQVKHQRSKTDRIDAKLLALYAQEQRPAFWQPLAQEIEELGDLVKEQEELDRAITQQRNRLASPRLRPAHRQRLEEQLTQLQNQQKQVKQEIKELVREQDKVKAVTKRLQSIVGIGEQTATQLVAIIGDIHRFASARALVSFAGLGVKEMQSGISQHGKPCLMRTGHRKLRRTLYMSALTVFRVAGPLQDWAKEKIAEGKPKKVMMVALMRKLLHIVYGVWTKETDYDVSKVRGPRPQAAPALAVA
jgi:transposase